MRVSIEGATISADHRVLQLETVAWAPYAESDPCSAGYAAWAELRDDRLVAAIHETIPPRTDQCDLLGYRHEFEIELAAPYDDAELLDLAGGTLLVRPPDSLAVVEGIPAGWEFRATDRWRSNLEMNRNASVERTGRRRRSRRPPGSRISWRCTRSSVAPAASGVKEPFDR